MLTFLTVLHIFVSFALIILVLIQDSKGDAMGALGGGGSGGSNSLFGATGATSFLAKVTRGAAVVFAATSISLAMHTTTKGNSVVDSYVPSAQTGTAAPEAEKGQEAAAGATEQKPTEPENK